MNRTDQNPEAMLDAIIDEVRAEEPDARTVEEAGKRVWALIAAEAARDRNEAILSCAGFQALFPSFREGTLSESRRMLLEDHLHECVPCRKALHALTDEPKPKVVAMPARKPMAAPAKWAIAAALIIGVGSGSWYTWNNFGPAPAGSRARVLTADGGVYRLQGSSLIPAVAGAELGESEVLRTTGGGHASVQLIDGSTVEAGERAEFSVSATRRDTTVHLDRGQIIIQAAKRHTGHLYVSSADSRVAVTGTVFSVNRGIAGSRVSVVEGEVHVEHGNAKDVLHAGDQVTTHPSMEKTSVADDIAWSRNYDQYLALLKQFVEIRSKLSQVHLPGLRYGSRLMDSVPEGTSIYVSLPNLGRAISDLQRIINEQAGQSPELQSWMKTQLPEFEKTTSQLTRIGEFLGDEIVFASQSCKGFCGILIAEVHRPGLKEYIDGELAKSGGHGPDGMKIVYDRDRVIFGERQAFIDAAQRRDSQFASSPFGQTISDVYKRGAGLFVAANIEGMLAGEDDREDKERFRKAGANQARHLIAEQKEVNGKAEYSAVMTFKGPRQGIASWLAAPGAMGSLGFVSPDAQFASSFVVKQPAAMLADMLALTDANTHAKAHSAEFEQMFGVSLNDLAGYLGGEATIAIDGPMIPVPSWKVAAEVRDAKGLQAAVAKLAATGNLAMTQETINGRTYYSVKPPAGVGLLSVEVHYTYVDGYLLAAANRALLDRAIRDRASGVTLARSQEFKKLLPRDSRANFSAMLYQNAGDLLRIVAQAAPSMSNATPEQQKKAEEIAGNVEPTLICFYGESDRIEVASQGTVLNLIMQPMLGNMLRPGLIKGTMGSQPAYR